MLFVCLFVCIERTLHHLMQIYNQRVRPFKPMERKSGNSRLKIFGNLPIWKSVGSIRRFSTRLESLSKFFYLRYFLITAIFRTIFRNLATIHRWKMFSAAKLTKISTTEMWYSKRYSLEGHQQSEWSVRNANLRNWRENNKARTRKRFFSIWSKTNLFGLNLRARRDLTIFFTQPIATTKFSIWRGRKKKKNMAKIFCSSNRIDFSIFSRRLSKKG